MASILAEACSNGTQEQIAWGKLHGLNIVMETLDYVFNFVLRSPQTDINNAACLSFAQFLDLSNEKIFAGRGTGNDLVLTLENLPELFLKATSGVHFSIERGNCDLANPVYIQDFSLNGTFVNGELIGLNRTCVLKNDDIISLNQRTHNTFVFEDLSPSKSPSLPEELAQTYKISRSLGAGGFGEVWLTYNARTYQPYALKIVNRKTDIAPGATDPAIKEAEITRSLSHPCVIRMPEALYKRTAVYMLLEFMSGGDLLRRVSSKIRLSEEISKLYFYQMCQAVKYLHNRDIIHRDIKLANILLDSHEEITLVKLCDFGLSRIDDHNSIYTPKVDIWSLGVVLYCCLSGMFPFTDKGGYPLEFQILKGRVFFPNDMWYGITKSAKCLIKQIFTVDPKKRPSIRDILECNWLRDLGMQHKAEAVMEARKLPTKRSWSI